MELFDRYVQCYVYVWFYKHENSWKLWCWNDENSNMVCGFWNHKKVQNGVWCWNHETLKIECDFKITRSSKWCVTLKSRNIEWVCDSYIIKSSSWCKITSTLKIGLNSKSSTYSKIDLSTFFHRTCITFNQIEIFDYSCLKVWIGSKQILLSTLKVPTYNWFWLSKVDFYFKTYSMSKLTWFQNHTCRIHYQYNKCCIY